MRAYRPSRTSIASKPLMMFPVQACAWWACQMARMVWSAKTVRRSENSLADTVSGDSPAAIRGSETSVRHQSASASAMRR